MCINGGSVIDFDRSRGAWASSDPGGVRQIAAHTHLFFEGDARDRIYIVESGWVKLYRTLIDGQRQVVGFANSGSVLGIESDTQYSNSCEAITDVVIRPIPASRLNGICKNDPALADQVLKHDGGLRLRDGLAGGQVLVVQVEQLALLRRDLVAQLQQLPTERMPELTHGLACRRRTARAESDGSVALGAGAIATGGKATSIGFGNRVNAESDRLRSECLRSK